MLGEQKATCPVNRDDTSQPVPDLAGHNDNQMKLRLLILVAVIGLCSSVYQFLIDSPYKGSADLHATIEMVGALMGIIAGFAFITRFYALGNRLSLFIGLAFFINGAEDFIHGLLAFADVHELIGPSSSSLKQFIPGTYVTGRMLLGLILLATPFINRRFGDSKNPPRETARTVTVVMILAIVATALAFRVPLPQFIYPELLISRPVDLISAVILLMALYAFLKEYFRSRNPLVWWICLSIGINIVGQVIMAFSKTLYDPFFDIAHVYKVIGYALPLVGFILNQIRVISSQQESDDKFRKITDSALDSIIMMDHLGLVRFWNKAAEKMFGRTETEMIGQDLHELITPDRHQAEFLKAHPHFLHTGQGPIIGTIREVEALRRDGTEFPAEISISPVKIKGRFNAVGIVRDTTERKRAEENYKRLSRAVEATADAVMVTDSSGVIRSVNPAFTRISGYMPEDTIGKTPRLLKSGKEPASFYKDMWQTILRGDDWQGEVTNKKKDGSLYYAALSISPITDDRGKVDGFVGVQRDVTAERKAAEEIRRQNEELKVAWEKAESAAKTKSEFLANMSHEIRTPMNGIIGMVDLTLGTRLTAEQEEFLQMAKSSGNSLLHIINDILDFSKIEAGQMGLEVIDFNLRETIEGAVEPLAIKANEKGLEVITFIDPSVPEYAAGDPVRLRQVIVNLSDNALKFTEKGEIVVSVKLAESIDRVDLNFSIADTGIGIPKEKQAGIFESFTQADGSTTREYGGTGLGTTISKQLVELMGGKIWIDSPTNQTNIGGPGSTFHFTASFGRSTSKRVIDKKVMQVRISGKKVLIVDDNMTNRRLLSILMDNWDLEPTAVASGYEAIDLMAAARNKPRLLLLRLPHRRSLFLFALDLLRHLLQSSTRQSKSSFACGIEAGTSIEL